MAEPLLPARSLFRLAAICHHQEVPAAASAARFADKGLGLSPQSRLVCFEELENRPVWADVRACWCEEGLGFSLAVTGKRRPPMGDDDRPTQGDSLQLWIDTRDTKGIHRASRFCHHFVFLPNGGGRRKGEPMVEHLLIHRAKEHPRRAESEHFRLRAEKRVDGYLLEMFITSMALTGYDPVENPRMGFTYLVNDQEHGQQSFSCAPSMPFREDPSLWGTLELVS